MTSIRTPRPGHLHRAAGAGLGLVLLAVLAPTAFAALRTIEQAYELARSQIALPDKPEGTLTVRPCAACSPVLLRVTPATTWFTRTGTRVPAGQAAFLAAFRAARAADTLIYVYYEPQTRRVKRIVLDVPAPVARP